MRIKFSLLMLSLFIITACGGGGSNTPANTVNIVSTPTVLEGSWKKSCSVSDPLDPGTTYDIITLSFTGNSFTSDIKNYSDSLCTTPFSYAPNPTASGYIEIGNQVTTTGGLNATELDSHITTFNGAPFIEDDYTIFIIQNNVLLMADDYDDILDGSTAQLRPDTINTNRQFIRQ